MEASSCALVVAGVLLLASTVQITGGAAIPPSITPAATSTTPTAATNSTVTSNNTNLSAADAPTSEVPGQQRADSGSQFLEAILDIYFGSRNKLTNTHSLRGHESNTQANTHVDVCSVQVIGLAAGPAVHGPTHGSSPRHRIQLNMWPLPALQPSCRVHLSAPPSNYLRIELIPSPDTLSSEEVDDAFDGERAMGFAAAMWGVDKESEDEGGDSADLFARRESRPTNSCTLAMLEDGKVAWSMNLCDVEDVQASKHHLDNVPHNVTLVWTPPPPGVGVRFPALTVTAVRKGVASDNLCSVRAVRLAGVGLESAMVLELRDDRPTDQRGSPCRASVATPPSHRLSFLLLNEGQAVEADSEAEPEDDAAPAKPSCVLSVLHGCASELWSGDLCDPTVKSSLNFTELFPNNVTLEWTAPVQRSAQLATTVLLTAVGKGKVCASRQFVPCWRRPRSQPLCVASELACDGYNNCPMDGNDEEPVLCRPNSKLTDVLGQTPTSSSPVTPAYPPDGKREFLGAIFDIYNKNRNRVANTHSSRGHDTNIHGDTSPDTLSSHGIWGYLMLTMLVCGAFLMLCGLWECCCKQPKAAPTAPSHTPTTVLMPQMGATGGVLVLDSDLDDDPSRPPAYEDLDQPPSYGVLFPPGLLAGQPKDDVEAVPAQTIDSVPPELLAEDFADADDVPSIRSSSSASVASSSISLAPS